MPEKEYFLQKKNALWQMRLVIFLRAEGRKRSIYARKRNDTKKARKQKTDKTTRRPTKMYHSVFGLFCIFCQNNAFQKAVPGNGLALEWGQCGFLATDTLWKWGQAFSISYLKPISPLPLLLASCFTSAAAAAAAADRWWWWWKRSSIVHIISKIKQKLANFTRGTLWKNATKQGRARWIEKWCRWRPLTKWYWCWSWCRTAFDDHSTAPSGLIVLCQAWRMYRQDGQSTARLHLWDVSTSVFWRKCKQFFGSGIYPWWRRSMGSSASSSVVKYTQMRSLIFLGRGEFSTWVRCSMIEMDPKASPTLLLAWKNSPNESWTSTKGSHQVRRYRQVQQDRGLLFYNPTQANKWMFFFYCLCYLSSVTYLSK